MECLRYRSARSCIEMLCSLVVKWYAVQGRGTRYGKDEVRKAQLYMMSFFQMIGLVLCYTVDAVTI